jgi:hypothetical protein
MSDDYDDPENTHNWNDEGVYADAVAELQDKTERRMQDEEYLASLSPQELEKEIRRRERQEEVLEESNTRMRKTPYMVTDRLLEEAKDIARRWRKEARRPLGVVGEIAEQEAARLLHLSLMGQGNPGYDGVWDNKKVQIKGRCLKENGSSPGRIPSISFKKDWDSVLLVILDHDLKPKEIFEAVRKRIKQELLGPRAKQWNRRGQMSISKFKRIADRVWPR